MVGTISRALAAIVLLAGLSQQAAAQLYPSKPVRMLVAFPAGGSADVAARIVAQKLGERIGQRFPAENRTGAGPAQTAAFMKEETARWAKLIKASGAQVG